MNCLITGAGGFIGSFLVEALVSRQATVHAVCRRPSPFLTDPHASVTVHPGDVTDRDFLRGVVQKACPDLIVHLASQSLPEISWKDPAHTFRVNLLGLLHLLEAVRETNRNPLTICACSSSEYAPSKKGAPIPEDGPLGPSSLYAVSKVTQDQMAQLYAQKYSLRVIRVRPFFLIGPRKTGDVCSDFARRIVDIERGKAPDLPVGNLETVRDFLDVRDGVAALVHLAERGQPGEVYNICSGQGYAIRFLLDILKSYSKASIRERVDAKLMRPIDEPVKVGDPSRLKTLGWQPRYELKTTLSDILDYWREEGLKIKG